ncbi:MAG: hypothetical protein R3F62_07730 [Planctomycetota bacterium]
MSSTPEADREVTAATLKAAASTPGEMLEVLRAEARARKAAAPASPATSAAASASEALTSSALFARALAGHTRVGGVAPRARPEPTRPAEPPRPAPEPLPAPGTETAPLPAVEPRPAVEARSASRAPAPEPARLTEPVRSPEPTRAAPTIVVRRPASWPVAAAVLGAGAAVAGVLWLRPAPPPTVVIEPAPAPAVGPAPARVEPAAGLAPLGPGRVVQRAGDDLLILSLDELSGELIVERVYRLSQDAGRYLSEPGKRNAHGYYLDDRGTQAKEELALRVLRLERTVGSVVDRDAKLEDAEARARAVVEVGGAPQLVEHLSGPLRDAEASVFRLAVTLALAEEGYLIALEPLAGLLETHADNPELARRLLGLANGLTGLRLSAADPVAAAARLRAWVGAHPLADRFARVQ